MPTPRKTSAPTPRPHLVVKTWRDRFNPDAGGAEVWLDEVLSRLRTSWDITVLTRESADRPNHEVVDGIAYVRRGGVFTQYLAAHVSQRRLARPADVVLDVFNGVPFLSVLNRAHPVVVVVHHVHREQWTMVFGPVVGRIGWATERTCATLQRRCRHVTVSAPSAAAISANYRIPRERIVIAHNGFTPAPTSLPTVDLVPAAHRLVALGRLVPHKRVEVAIAALADARATGLDVHLDVVGDGEWRDDLATSASGLDVARHVTFHGLVDEATKHAILAAADLLVLPSVREGWGIVVIEAAQHGVPAVAMASAGGTKESVRHGLSGVLATDDDDFRARVIGLLADPARRRELGRGATGLARRFTWEAAAATVDATLRAAIDDRLGRGPPTRLTRGTGTTTLGDALGDPRAGTPSDPTTDRPTRPGSKDTSMVDDPAPHELFATDAYRRAAEATVSTVDGVRIVLDRTVFYPGGGGQPADRGTITWDDADGGQGRAEVVGVGRRHGAIHHELDVVEPDAAPPPGTPVHLELDWGRRYRLMRTHTALHILCGVIWEDFGVAVTGGNMEPGTGRLDFALDAVTAELGEAIQRRLNEEVERAHEIVVEFVDRTAGELDPALIRTKADLIPASINPLRVIDIVGLDRQADGGTHVARTTEVGRIEVTKTENKGRDNKRIRLAIHDA